MALKFFTIPIFDSDRAEAEANAFIRKHKVLTVDRRCVEHGGSSVWTLCVDYLEGAVEPTTEKTGSVRSKLDYREILKPEEFVVFAKLRDLRKTISTTEGVPLYHVFNNEQLAQMAQGKAKSKEDLRKIAGMGEARLEKYGERVLEALRDEASGAAV